MRMYSLYDSKSLQFTHPFGQINDNCAIRVVMNDLRTPGNLINTNPEDFTLYYVGEFDEAKGQFIAEDKILLAKGDQIMNNMTAT